MPEDLRTDEDLVAAYRLGDEHSFEVLYYRYFKGLGFYIRKTSRYKDADFVEEVRQLTFIKISEKIRGDEFTPAGPGSFRAFLYETARRITFDQNEKRLRLARPVSEVFTDEELPGLTELVLVKEQGTDYDRIKERINEVTAELQPAELKLMKLVAAEVPYKEIQKEPEFRKYSVDYLMLKVYNIRKRFRKKEGQI